MRNWLRVWVSVGWVLGNLTVVEAGVYHVGVGGDDGGDGSEGRPWRTIQHAVDLVGAGDEVVVGVGVYGERLVMRGKVGTVAAPIRIKAYGAVVDLAGVVPPNGDCAVVEVVDCEHVVLEGLEIRNWKTSAKLSTPIGIWVHGSGDGLEIRNCKVHDIWQSFTNKYVMEANGFGVLVQGDQELPIQGLVLEGCEVYQLRTGASESVSLNGNVRGFRVTGNRVHDCNNIGIDMIGHEGTAPSEVVDQAREGECVGNEVWAIDSKWNPAYGGNFTTGGGNGTRSAPGIYVDGGRDIRIERNHVHGCNFAISLGSEWAGKSTSGVVLRNNLLHHCHVGGLVMGGSDAVLNGGVDGCVVEHNTFYQNDTVGYGGGQVSVQHHVSQCLIRHNVLVCNPRTGQMVLNANTTSEFASGSVDWNCYGGGVDGQLEWIWKNQGYASLSMWRAASGQDAHSRWVSAVGFAGVDLQESTVAESYRLVGGSVAVDAGDPEWVGGVGELDFWGHPRKVGMRVDVGAGEWLSEWQAWSYEQFGQLDGRFGEDDDGDGWVNGMEYALGMDPHVAGGMAGVEVGVVQGKVRFRYRKVRASAKYGVEYRPSMGGVWQAWTGQEMQDGSGWNWVEKEVAGGGFFRLRVEKE